MDTLSAGLADGIAVQLLILGVGMDQSFEEQYSSTSHVYGVDLPEVIEARRDQQDSHIRLIPGDLRAFDSVWTSLLGSGFDPSFPTVVLIECVMCYIDTSYVGQLLTKLSQRLVRGLVVSYDPCVPMGESSNGNGNGNGNGNDSANGSGNGRASDSGSASTSGSASASASASAVSNGFAEMLRSKFSERGAPLRHCVGSLAAHQSFIQSCGWVVKSWTIHHAMRSFFSPSERAVPATAEPFDEFASLALLCRVYGVTLAGNDEVSFVGALTRLSPREACVYVRPTTASPVLPTGGTSNTSNTTNSGDDSNDSNNGVNNSSSSSSSSNSCWVNASSNIRPHIRPAAHHDNAAVAQLLTVGFREVVGTVPAVRKYMTKCVRGLDLVRDYKLGQTGGRGGGGGGGRGGGGGGGQFWVAVEGDMVVGCIGLKFSAMTSIGATTADARMGTVNADGASQSQCQTKGQGQCQEQEKGQGQCQEQEKGQGQCQEQEKGQGQERYRHEYEVSHMCVHPDRRRCGVARALLTALLAFVDEMNGKDSHKDSGREVGETGDTIRGTLSPVSPVSAVSAVSLHLTVLDVQAAARALYTSAGFVDRGAPVVLQADTGPCRMHHMVR